MSDEDDDLEALRQAALSSLIKKQQKPSQTNAVFYRPISNSNLISIQPLNSSKEQNKDSGGESDEDNDSDASSSGSEYRVIEEGLSVSSGDVDEVIEEVVVSEGDESDEEATEKGVPADDDGEDAISIATHDSFEDLLSSVENELDLSKKKSDKPPSKSPTKDVKSANNSNGRQNRTSPRPASSYRRRNRTRSPPKFSRTNYRPRSRSPIDSRVSRNRMQRSRSPLRDNRRRKSRSPLASSRRYRSRSPVENRNPRASSPGFRNRQRRNYNSRSPPPGSRRRVNRPISPTTRNRNEKGRQGRNNFQNRSNRNIRSRSGSLGLGSRRNRIGTGRPSLSPGSNTSNHPSSRSNSPGDRAKRHKLSFGDHRLRQRSEAMKGNSRPNTPPPLEPIGDRSESRNSNDSNNSSSKSKPKRMRRSTSPNALKNLSPDEKLRLEKRKLKFQSTVGKVSGKVVLNSKELPRETSETESGEIKDEPPISSKRSIASRLGKIVTQDSNNHHEDADEINRGTSSKKNNHRPNPRNKEKEPAVGKDDLRTKLQQKRAANAGRIFSVVLKDTLKPDSSKSPSHDESPRGNRAPNVVKGSSN